MLDCSSVYSGRNLMSDTIWVYWEGAKPDYIVLCCKTIFTHNDNVVLLDRSGFDHLYTQERHLDIDQLDLNHKSDFIRAYLLKYYGGLYVDADCIVMKNLNPALEKAKQFGFTGYREPQGYMSCNFLASIRGGEVISAHYERVCETLRSKRPLEWLDLASVPMNEVIDIYPDHSFLLPTDAVMPVAWNESEKLCARRLDEEHEQSFNHEALCYMLANNTIKSREQTQILSHMSEEQLLRDNYFISFLFRKSLNIGA